MNRLGEPSLTKYIIYVSLGKFSTGKTLLSPTLFSSVNTAFLLNLLHATGIHPSTLSSMNFMPGASLKSYASLLPQSVWLSVPAYQARAYINWQNPAQQQLPALSREQQLLAMQPCYSPSTLFSRNAACLLAFLDFLDFRLSTQH